MNLEDIAKQFSVSVATVSRVKNNKPGVNKKVRKEILQFFESENISFKDNINTIAVIVGDLENPFFGEIVKTISQKLLKKGFLLSLYDTNEDINIEKQVVKHILSNPTSGVIFCISDKEKSIDHLNALEKASIPTILFDRELETHSEGVFFNDFKSAFIATEYLISKGYKKIALVKGPSHLPHIENRVKGYCYALQKNNINIDETIIYEGDMKQECGAVIMALIAKTTCDAVIILNNFMTIGAISYINNTNISLYDKIKIMGYDAPSYIQDMHRKVSFVTRDYKETGNLIANMMINKLENPTNHLQKIIIEPVLKI